MGYAVSAITRMDIFRAFTVMERLGVRVDTRVTTLLYWVILFLIIAVVAAILGFGGIAGVAAAIAKIIFWVFLVLFLLFLIMALTGVGSIRRIM